MTDHSFISMLPLDGHTKQSAFALESDAGDPNVVKLLVSPLGSRTAPFVIWARRFETGEDRSAVLAAIDAQQLDVAFLGRVTMVFGGIELDRIVDRMLTEAWDARQTAATEAIEKARKHQIVELYALNTKRGYALELERESRSTADWTVLYDRASERDRLRDWLCWQGARYLDFLDYAAENGDEALTRLLTDQMFMTERRVKKEGRGAGGARPLRMWRGD